jgi:hypothetical protein
MITQCEKYLHNIRAWSFGDSDFQEHMVTPLSASRWSWPIIDAAAAKLRLKDGTRAVAKLERDCHTRGLIKDTRTTGSYQPGERSIHLAARTVTERALDTVFHEFAHAMLHHDVDEQQYVANQEWIEAEADVTCDLVRCMLGSGPRIWTIRTLSYMADVGDVAAFFHFAGDAMVCAACAIVRAVQDSAMHDQSRS